MINYFEETTKNHIIEIINGMQAETTSKKEKLDRIKRALNSVMNQEANP